MRGAETTMLNRFAMLASVCVAIPVAAAPLAQADPPAPPDPAVPVNATNPLPPEGGVPSGPPGVLDTPDGWHLEVVGANETQLPVAPFDHRDLLAGVPGRGHLHRQDHRRRQDQADRRIDGG